MENCPTEALERNKEGLIFVEEEKCIGCGKCADTCTIGAVKLHPERNIPQVCHQCGGTPLCVEKCPSKALEYMETETQQPTLPEDVAKDTLKRWGIIA